MSQLIIGIDFIYWQNTKPLVKRKQIVVQCFKFTAPLEKLKTKDNLGIKYPLLFGVIFFFLSPHFVVLEKKEYI